MVNTQDWLNKKYPNKNGVKRIEMRFNETVNGDLLIADFPDLEEICFSSSTLPTKRNIPNFEIKDCPQLFTISCRQSQINNLTITNCPWVKTLYVCNNNLTTLDISNFANLTKLQCEKNSLSTLDISHNPKLTELRCKESLQPLNQLTIQLRTELQVEKDKLTDLQTKYDQLKSQWQQHIEQERKQLEEEIVLLQKLLDNDEENK